jgi:hypothetical protein
MFSAFGGSALNQVKRYRRIHISLLFIVHSITGNLNVPPGAVNGFSVKIFKENRIGFMMILLRIC